MKKRQPTSPIHDLVQVRENGTYSSTNLIRGSMIQEMFVIFSEYLGNNDKKYLMNRVMADNIVHKNSYYSRENVWRIFDQRYLSCSPWIVQAIASSTSHGINSPDFLSLAYLYYAFRERMAYDIITKVVWSRWNSKRTALDSGAILEFIVAKGSDVATVKHWGETTVRRCASSTLSSLRDFGILKGAKNKSIQRPTVAPEAAFHLLCILMAEGYEGRSLIAAKDWRLFLWDEADVIDSLNRMAMKQWIRFERSGPTTILELVRLPGEKQ